MDTATVVTWGRTDLGDALAKEPAEPQAEELPPIIAGPGDSYLPPVEARAGQVVVTSNVTTSAVLTVDGVETVVELKVGVPTGVDDTADIAVLRENGLLQ